MRPVRIWSYLRFLLVRPLSLSAAPARNFSIALRRLASISKGIPRTLEALAHQFRRGLNANNNQFYLKVVGNVVQALSVARGQIGSIKDNPSPFLKQLFNEEVASVE